MQPRSGIWVGLLKRSLEDIADNTQDMFHPGFPALSKHFGALVLHTLDEAFK